MTQATLTCGYCKEDALDDLCECPHCHRDCLCPHCADPYQHHCRALHCYPLLGGPLGGNVERRFKKLAQEQPIDFVGKLGEPLHRYVCRGGALEYVGPTTGRAASDGPEYAAVFTTVEGEDDGELAVYHGSRVVFRARVAKMTCVVKWPTGWGYRNLTMKRHYFVNGASLCGRWLYDRNPLHWTITPADNNTDHRDTCKQCKSILAKRNAA